VTIATAVRATSRLIAAVALTAVTTTVALEAGDLTPAPSDEAVERAALKRARGRGTLIDVRVGQDNHVTVVAVHGLAGRPSDLAPVMNKEIAAGNAVKAFAYDAKFRSLNDSSRDLAELLATLSEADPAIRLRIYAHSLGGRVALGAVARLSSEGRLTSDIELNLIAVPLAGLRRANVIRFLPRFLPGVRPLNDVASSSAYQRMIDSVRLPDNVRVSVFAGAQDAVFSHSTPKYRALVDALHATLLVFPKATHMSTVDEVARLR
jgi:pimeloyl-ACP methyl ester carboxylesterase